MTEKITEIGLIEQDIKVLDAIRNNAKKVLSDENIYRIRDVYSVLYDYFRKENNPLSRESIRTSVCYLERVGLLRRVAKTVTRGCVKPTVVFEFIEENFVKAEIVRVRSRKRVANLKKSKIKDDFESGDGLKSNQALILLFRVFRWMNF